MYRTCAFCNGAFDGDGGPSGLGVGRRLAFDEWRGRLWVICGRCGRWNLTPFDDRLDRIERVAQAASRGRVAAATEQVALIRWEQYDFVRVGKPPRIEYATWRYGERLKARRREQLKYVLPLTVAAVGLTIAVNAVAGGSMFAFVGNTAQLGRYMYTGIIGQRRVILEEPPICASCGAVMVVRARHLQRARMVRDAHAGMGLALTCPNCGREGAQLIGSDAQLALRRGLTYLNLKKPRRQRAEDAARLVDSAGGPDALVHDVARAELTLRSLRPERRLALEMAVEEQVEVQELERRWREAEELAEIADGTLSGTDALEEELRRLKENPPSQPNG